MEFIVASLKTNKVIKERSLTEVLRKIVCSVKNEYCMMGYCDICENKELDFSYENDFKIKFKQWKRIKEEKIINGKKKIIVKVIKVKECGYVSLVIENFKKELKTFKQHVFYQIHQTEQVRKVKEGLKNNEIMFRIDFSENYVAKYEHEVQAIHFGASKRQITFHTGVLYTKCESKVKATGFCTVSDNLDHQAHGVWAHMKPILEMFGKSIHM